MRLRNPFSNDTRNLFLDSHGCWLCRSNQMLTLHHIYSRISSSALNASLVCDKCHSHMGHTQEEHRKLLKLSLQFLARKHYSFTQKDTQFILKIEPDFSIISRELLED